MHISKHELASLKAWVRGGYERSGLESKVVDALVAHNDRVLTFTEQVADGESVTPDERELLVTVAVLHDCAKADADLLHHADLGAERASDKLTEMGKDPSFVAAVENAIRCHMGPFPFVEEEVRKHAERTGEHLDIPRPRTRIEKLFYDADMLTLMDVSGIEKVVVLRSTTPEFRAEDEQEAERTGGSRLAAAYASALESVHRAAATLFSATAKRIAGGLADEAERHVAEQLGAGPPRTATAG